MSAEFRSVTGRAYQPFVPVAQNTEQARPKRQAAGETPVGDAICGCDSTFPRCGTAVPRPRRRCDSVHPLQFGGVAHQQSARLTCERQRGRHSPLPPFRGHSSASQSGCVTCTRLKVRILLPSPLLSLWCSPANTPASHAGDHRSKAGQGHQFSRPQSILSDALLWYGSQSGAIPGGGSNFRSCSPTSRGTTSRASPVQVQTLPRAPVSWSRSHSRPAPDF